MTADSGAVNIPTPTIFQRHAYNFFFLRQANGPLALRKTLKVNPDNCPFSGDSNLQTKIAITMEFTKRIFTFIFLWLILSCVLLEHTQGFEVRPSRRARRSKHKPRETKGNHHQYVKQMADLFSRLVVCMKGKKCFVSCLFFVLLYFFCSSVSQFYYSWHSREAKKVSVAGAGCWQECKSTEFLWELRKNRFCESSFHRWIDWVHFYVRQTRPTRIDKREICSPKQKNVKKT